MYTEHERFEIREVRGTDLTKEQQKFIKNKLEGFQLQRREGGRS